MKHPTTHPLYLLDAKNELFQVYDVHEWAKKFPEQYHLARDEIGSTGFAVETVFLGMAALYDEIGKMQVYALPFYFETVVYAANGRAVDADKYQARCGKELTAGIPVAANRPAIVPGLHPCR